MSGHSHFSTIKRKKEVTDKKRGQIFSKLSKIISMAAREKGSDPERNPKLRLAIERARAYNLPKENIERAIKKGSGELADEKLEEIIFEAYGPGGTAIIIEGITDNKNRTLGEIKQILNQNNGKLANEGSVRWMFERKGFLAINPDLQTENLKNKESLELLAIEAEAEDFLWRENFLEIFTRVEDLEKTKKNLETKKIKIDSASLGWLAKEKILIDDKAKQACQKLFEALDENDSVQEIYSNIKQ